MALERSYADETPVKPLPELSRQPSQENHHPKSMPGQGEGRVMEMRLRKAIMDMPMRTARRGAKSAAKSAAGPRASSSGITKNK